MVDQNSAWVVVLNVNTAKILLGLRSKGSNNPNQWNLFGGGIEKKEKALESAIRELKEEFGLKAKPGRFVKIGKLKLKRKAKPTKILHFYLLPVAFKPAKDKINKKEIKRAKWFGFDELPKRLHAPTAAFFKSPIFPILIKQVAKYRKRSQKEAKASVNFLVDVYETLGMSRSAYQEVLANLPEGVELSQLIDLLRPITENYRDQIDDLKAELAWAYTALDDADADHDTDIVQNISNYQGALRALNQYTQGWFAEQPVSYERLGEIAGLVKSRLLLFLKERDIPPHFDQLVRGNYERILALRQASFNEDTLEDGEVADE